MTDFLLRLFVKDGNIQSPDVRQKCGQLGGVIGIIVNLLLFAGKFTAGRLFGSVAITADAVNNLSDAGSSVIALFSFKLSNKPADKEHPFGHARMEYIASLIVSFIILSLGLELIKSSFSKIISPDAINFSIISVVVLAVSILLKLWLYFFNKNVGKKINSLVMQATAADSLSDVLATSAVLVSLFISKISGFQLDGYMGIAVACFIIAAGIKIISETFDHLLGRAPDAKLVREIESFINKYDGVLGMHDLVVHSYGPDKRFASVHVEVCSGEDIMDSHDMIDNIERDTLEELGIHLVIHLDPVVTNDEQVNSLRRLTAEVLEQIDPSLGFHDFRAVTGPTHTNLIFDVTVPFEYKKTDVDLSEEIKSAISSRDKTLFPVITLDRSYIPFSPEG